MISSLQQVVQTLLAHRLRSALAVIAIVWGIVSVLVLVALGEGFYRVNTQSFALLMSDTQMAFPSQTTKPWQGLAARRAITLSEPEMRALAQHPNISALSVIYGKWDAKVTNVKGRMLPGYVSGIDSQFLALRNLQLTAGHAAFTPAISKTIPELRWLVGSWHKLVSYLLVIRSKSIPFPSRLSALLSSKKGAFL